jgi:hypothetical protein
LRSAEASCSLIPLNLMELIKTDSFGSSKHN